MVKSLIFHLPRVAQCMQSLILFWTFKLKYLGLLVCGVVALQSFGNTHIYLKFSVRQSVRLQLNNRVTPIHG